MDWSVSSAVRRTDGIDAISGSPLFHARQRACGSYGNTRVEQRPRTSTASTDGRTALVLSVSWAALVSPRAARGSLFVARAAPPASNATRGRPLVPQTTQAAPKCERACRSTAPKTRARQPGFRVPMKCLDVEGALGRALDNCSQAAPAFICALASPPLAVWRRELRDASCQRRASIYSSTPYVHEFRSIAALRAVCTQKR